MTTEARSRWPLGDRRLLLIIPPLFVFWAMYWLQFKLGVAAHYLAPAFVQDGNGEAAGRMRTLATFALFVALAVAVIVYSFDLFARLDRRSRLTVGAGYALSMIVGISIVFELGVQKGDAYLERELPCAAFNLLKEPPSKEPPPKEQLQKRMAPIATPPRLPLSNTCQATPATALPLIAELGLVEARFPGDPYPILKGLIAFSAVLLFLAIPSMVWGAIACLALPTGGSRAERDEAWLKQTARLNRLLMITAGLMVASLLFNDARYGWAGYSLAPPHLATFNAQVSGFVLYYGVTSSILIASYYVPAAALLAAARPTKSAAGAKAVAEARAGDPFAAAKTVAAILAPALVGVLGEIVKFSR